MSARVGLVCLGLLATIACGEHEFEPPDRERQVEVATDRFRAADFDSIVWSDSAMRMTSGNELFAAHCRKCHGPLGRGATEYAAEQGLDVPSLVREDWPYDSIGQVRERIYAGHATGMPSWGVGRLTLREIDAVAWYVERGLRVEAAANPSR